MSSQWQEHRGFSSLMFSLSLVAAFLFTACGGGSNSAAPPPPPMSITIVPSAATLPEGGSQSFIATVAGLSNTAVTWSVQEGAVGGTITTSGIYTAPQAPGTYHIIATSQVDSSKSAIATASVSNFDSTGSVAIGRADHTATLPRANSLSEASLAMNRRNIPERRPSARIHE